jgi:hypothetical protein
MLKRQLFTALPMPTRVIKRVDTIGAQEAQGREFRFLNRNEDAFTWTDEVPADDPTFQGLLKEEEAVYPDITAELPGVPLEEEVVDHRAVTDKDELDFRVIAARALDNANINPATHLRAARAAEAQPVAPGPALIDAEKDEIIFEPTFDLPDVGLAPPIPPDCMAVVPHEVPVTHAFEPNPAEDTKPAIECQYPLRSCRSAIGHQPYDEYAPPTAFLQLGETRAYRSVIEASKLVRMCHAFWPQARDTVR